MMKDEEKDEEKSKENECISFVKEPIEFWGYDLLQKHL